jgi:hypothetical protein
MFYKTGVFSIFEYLIQVDYFFGWDVFSGTTLTNVRNANLPVKSFILRD